MPSFWIFAIAKNALNRFHYLVNTIQRHIFGILQSDFKATCLCRKQGFSLTGFVCQFTQNEVFYLSNAAATGSGGAFLRTRLCFIKMPRALRCF